MREHLLAWMEEQTRDRGIAWCACGRLSGASILAAVEQGAPLVVCRSCGEVIRLPEDDREE